MNILNLKRYNVLSIKEADHDYHIDVETVEPSRVCQTCYSENVTGGGRQEILIKDLPMHGKRVGIYVKARRFRCLDCGKTHTETLPDVIDDKRMTARCYYYVCKQSIERTFTSIAIEIGVSEGTIRNIFHEHVAALDKKLVVTIPEWMGIDEIHIINKPRCVITNIERNTIVDLLVNRDQTLLYQYFAKYKNRESVKCVAMDMWQPYKRVAYGCFPNAFIVIDKFHVLRMAQIAVEVVRKSIRSDLTPKQRRGLMHDRFLMLKRERDLTGLDRITLESWTLNFPALAEAYRAKEAFFDFYECMSIPEAKWTYNQWIGNCITPNIAEAFKPLITAMGNWETEILNYFDHPVTNAYTESSNNLTRFVNRCGRGYSFEALRAKILYSSGDHKIIHPKFKRKSEGSSGYGERTQSTVKRPKKLYYGSDLSTISEWIKSVEPT